MCDCDSTRDSGKFADWQDFHDFESWLAKNSEFLAVPVRTSLPGDKDAEKWFRCSKCDGVWRLVEPDPPFEGIWEKVS
jgi:hypothetical protein